MKPGDAAVMKLVNVLGPRQAHVVADEVLAGIGGGQLDNAQVRLKFGEALIKRGGLYEPIGRAIKVQALLHGARRGA